MQPTDLTGPPMAPRGKGSIFAYFATLLLIANLMTPGGALAQVPLQFYLKDQLHLGPSQSAYFSLIMFVPVYGAFLFGMVRDRWWPLGIRDRGFFLIFAPLAALAYLSLAYRHATYEQLLGGVLVITLIYRLIGPVVAGLTATVGNRLSMTGRLSSLVQFIGNVVGAGMAYLGGWVQGHLTPTQIYVLLASICVALFLIGFWRQPDVFQIGQPWAARRNLGAEVLRLVTHRPLWPAVLISLIWAFGPGQGTPLFFHLTKTVGMSAEQFGIYNTIGALTFIPGAALFGVLCRRIAPRRLLICATVFAVPQMIPLTYIASPLGAYVTSAFVGMVGGMAATAYYDLLLRSCPIGLEATTVELGITCGIIADRFGNVLGAKLYEHGGFALCNWITTGAYALILPAIFLIPKETIARRDGSVEEPISRTPGGSEELAVDPA